jgi:hypothetical protein
MAIELEFSTLFCEISDYGIRFWVATNCGNGVFSPLAAESSNNFSSPDFLVDSVVAQTLKQYRFRAPSLAVFIDGRGDESNGNGVDCEAIKKLLADSCGKVVELEKEMSRRACLDGAVLLSMSNKKRKKNSEAADDVSHTAPRVNVTSQEWAYNYLIPVTLREFYRRGIGFVACLSVFLCLCGGAYWFTRDTRSNYANKIARLQANTSKYLQEYAGLREYVEEFSQLGEWRNDPDIATQYSAVSSVLVRSNCLLVRAVFHSRVQDMAQKTVEEIGPEVERAAKAPITALPVAGIWELSIRLPVWGMNSSEARKNIVTALQKDAASVFGSTKSLLVLNEDQGNTMNMLRNDNGMNAVLFVWKAPPALGR